ncbi:hypothetical protein E4U42_005265 [Claviceps africana]|uniref:rRNA-processing protein EFG1 n=1 Tax=Claviceps africana TaxID=83212 RepID=A0A8K0JA15_9HYPO|nr:hypothetical protein E4U42_005265 [Claviceps africana]
MSMKRSFVDVDSQDHDRTSSSAASHGNTLNHRKRQKQHGTGNLKTKEDGTSFAKKRIRNIARLLQRNKDLPANVQNDLQRELATLKATIADKSFHRKRSAMISKYHMVRFFGRAERKKASRLAKQLKRKIEQSSDSADVEHLRRQLHIAEVDEAYTIYHPHLEPYRSLYGSVKTDSKDNQDDEEAEGDLKNHIPTAKIALDSERPPMWSVVEKAMEQGIEALQQLRERRPDDVSTSTAKPARAPRALGRSRADMSKQGQAAGQVAAKDKSGAKNEAKTMRINSSRAQTGEGTQLNRRERRRLMREAEAEKNSDDEEEGGGFFEGLS